MCGIAGKLYFDAARPVEEALLRRMNAVLAHRGPDDAGVWTAGPVGLAHRRLSIIDLSPGGHQPMANADGSVWITYNGEIYNFEELRAGLARHGVAFRSTSDTEVLLALYDAKGIDFLHDLRGMFAFALWDGRARRLLLARDRLGKKPLFYYRDAERFLFASEAKAILEDPDIVASPDMDAVHDYLTYGYVPAPRSGFTGIKKLPPAHYAIVGPGTMRIERYWQVRFRPKRVRPEAELREELLAQLREAVRIRLGSDVPLGAFLSGGVDSSAVVALMSEASSRPVKTFAIGFEEERYDELPFARMVAQRYGTDHHEFVVKPDAVAIAPELVWHYNEPYADSSAIATYYLAKLTRQHVTVALSGDAGDENFAGYQRYAAHALAARFDGVPVPMRRAIARAAAALPEVGSFRGRYRRARRFAAALDEDGARRYARWVGLFDERAKAALYTEDFAAATGGRDARALLCDAAAAAETDDLVDASLAVDFATYLPDDLLVKLDIASMAHSLEARAPMVDHRFVEFAASIPSDMKLRGWRTKHLLKEAVRPLLPAAVVDRPKQGFGVPLDTWFRRELRDMAYDLLLSGRSLGRGLFRRDAVLRLLDEHVSGRYEWHLHLWALLMLELWFQRFIDGPRQS